MVATTERTPMLPIYQVQQNGDMTPQHSNGGGKVVPEKSSPPPLHSVDVSVRRRRLILGTCSFIAMCTQMSLSFLSAFFPLEAQSRGMSEGTVGWVFSVFSITQLIVAPLTSILAAQIGAKYITTVGASVGAVSSVLLGLTMFLGHQNVFTGVFIVLRILQAAGMSSCATASFSIAVNTYNQNANFAVGILEGAVGVGVMMGPSLGGFVYDAGGFQLPFYLTGVVIAAVVPLTLFIMPKDMPTVIAGAGGARVGLDSTMFRMLRYPGVLVSCLAIVIISMVWLVFDPTLEPFLYEEFDLSASMVGLAFLLMAGCYAAFSPVAGWAADRVKDKAVLLAIGFLCGGFFLLFVGPTPLLHVDYSELWLVLLMLALASLCLSFANVPLLGKILDTCEANGIENDMKSYSAIAGLWYTLNALGEALGPILGSYVVKGLSFQWLCTVLTGVCLLMSGILGVLCLCEHRCCKRQGKQSGDNEATRLIK